MALRDLGVLAMLAVSSRWLDENEDRPILLSHPLLKAALEDIEEAHRELLSTERRVGTVEELIRRYTAMLTGRDSRHDRKARGIHRGFEAAIDLADDEAEVEQIEQIRDLLFPDGLSVTRASYHTQAGAALKVREKLTAEVRDFLAGFMVGKRDLLTEVLDWLDTADEIGRLVAERAKLQGDEDPDAISRADVQAARNAWIRATRNLITLMDVARVDAKTRRRLLANLETAERRALSGRKDNTAGTDAANAPQPPELAEIPETPEVPDLV